MAATPYQVFRPLQLTPAASVLLALPLLRRASRTHAHTHARAHAQQGMLVRHYYRRRTCTSTSTCPRCLHRIIVAAVPAAKARRPRKARARLSSSRHRRHTGSASLDAHQDAADECSPQCYPVYPSGSPPSFESAGVWHRSLPITRPRTHGHLLVPAATRPRAFNASPLCAPDGHPRTVCGRGRPHEKPIIGRTLSHRRPQVAERPPMMILPH